MGRGLITQLITTHEPPGMKRQLKARPQTKTLPGRTEGLDPLVFKG